MNGNITEIAGYLADRIPTGAEEPQARLQDWRTTLYNAVRTRSVRPLADLVRRSAPEDPHAAELCEGLAEIKPHHV